MHYSIWLFLYTVESDKVRSFGYQATPTSATVYWSPPVKPNGVIQFYTVKHYPLPQTDRQGGLSDLAALYMSPVPYTEVYNACEILSELNVSTYSPVVDAVLNAISQDSVLSSIHLDLIFNVTSHHFLSSNNTDEIIVNQTVDIIATSLNHIDIVSLKWMSDWNVWTLDLCYGLLWVRDSEYPYIGL